MLWIALLCVLAVKHIRIADGLECYTCTNVTTIDDCKHTTVCSGGSNCSVNSILHHQVNGSSSLVGRSLGTCIDCCRSNNCNRQLCQGSYQYCDDTADFDCNSVGSVVNFCLDSIHAKTKCRRFCGFCSMVDGGWAPWSAWSTCDVTCGNGTKTRTRQCSDPRPVDGGAPCLGSSQQTTACRLDLCPVHGGWSKWSAWGSCSKTCDIGMQRRDRSCSNPYPVRNGDHCFGESRDDRLCFPGACADGAWSSWSQWTNCSKFCGGGFHTRVRSCDNPAPSIVGRNCVGSPSQTESCNTVACPAFTATHCLTSGNRLIFNSTSINVGNGYSPITGRFTCIYPGLYHFTADIVKERDANNAVDMISAYIRKNGANVATIYTDPTDDDTDKGSYSATGSIILHLEKGDYVDVNSVFRVSSFSIFSGFLYSVES